MQLEEARELENQDSRRKVQFFFRDKPDDEGRIGEISIKSGNMMIKGATKEDEDFLIQRMAMIWVPQAGVPVFRKENGEFEKDGNGKYITEKYVSSANASPDEVVEAIHDFTKAMGIFRVELVPV